MTLLVTLAGSLLVLALAPVAAEAATFGIEKFFSGTCGEAYPECAQEGTAPYLEPKKPSKEESEREGYTQAAGRVPYGITDFQVNSEGTYPNKKPIGILTHLRTDVAPGFATAPAAVPACSLEEFGTEEQAGSGLYKPPTCKPETVIGEQKATVYVKDEGVEKDVAVTGTVYNLVQKPGQASLFGVAIELPESVVKEELSSLTGVSAPTIPVPAAGELAHTLIEGGVEYGKEAKGTNEGDYHDWFEVNVSPSLPILRSRLLFNGHSGDGAFLTNATECPGHTTTTLTLESKEGATDRQSYTPPISLSGCEKIPFEPKFRLSPETAQPDQPDGITTEVEVPHNPKVEIDNSDVRTGTVSLPEGMTLNPSAAHGLGVCTAAQANLHTAGLGNACPADSVLGTDTLETPNLPAGSLTGDVYLGGPESGPITGPPFTIYIEAQSPRYGVAVRVQGSVTPNPVTGRVSATFDENPEQPLGNLILQFKTGALAPVANPLACGAATSNGSFTGFSGGSALSALESFGVACSGTPPFSLSQSTGNAPPTAGAASAYTLNIARADGQQFLSQVKTVLPEGLVGLIPTVTRCGEAQANSGECPAASKIGVVAVEAGAGPMPYAFSGNVYLTGPYDGAPFGLSIVVPTVAGPFNFGNVITRATINVEPYTARVITTATVPTIVQGVPIRLKRLNVEINKPGFLHNPTNCGVLNTESTFSGLVQTGLAAGATQSLSTPFQVGNCSALAFKPSFGSATGAKTSKANGASLETTINMPAGDSNIKSVLVQLPKQLPSRLTTLQKACTEAVFNRNPYSCPSGSFVGGVRANTPTLSAKLKGPAILVSHGGAAFPDLDLLLEGEGIRVILVGNTKISSSGITTTNFASPPDVPVSSITVNLPIGAHSALTANGNVCAASKLVMPTTLTGQNGVVVKQNTAIKVAGCGVQIISHRIAGHKLVLEVKTFAAGRISIKGGKDLKTVSRRLSKARTVTLKIPLSHGGLAALQRRRKLKISVRVAFVPKQKKVGNSAATTAVKFK